MSAWVGLGIAAASTITSLTGSSKARKAAKKATKKNAQAIRLETAESVRRQEIANKRQLAQGVANVGASGARMTGSPQDYLSFVEGEQHRQLNWMKESGERQAQIMRKTGQDMATQQKYQGISSAVNIWSNAYTSGMFASNQKSSYVDQQPQG